MAVVLSKSATLILCDGSPEPMTPSQGSAPHTHTRAWVGRGNQTSAVNRIIHPSPTLRHALHAIIDFALVQDVDALCPHFDFRRGGGIDERFCVLQAGLVEVRDGDAGAAFAGEGDGDRLADTCVFERLVEKRRGGVRVGT